MGKFLRKYDAVDRMCQSCHKKTESQVPNIALEIKKITIAMNSSYFKLGFKFGPLTLQRWIRLFCFPSYITSLELERCDIIDTSVISVMNLFHMFCQLLKITNNTGSAGVHERLGVHHTFLSINSYFFHFTTTLVVGRKIGNSSVWREL